MHRPDTKALVASLVLLGMSSCAGLPDMVSDTASPDLIPATSRATGGRRTGPRPLKVYIMAGQSNMQGQGLHTTFPHIAMDPKTLPIYSKMFHEDGTARVLDDIWISTIGCARGGPEGKLMGVKSGKLTTGYGSYRRGVKIGPELTFGIYMQEHVKEPILIIKTAWGGKSLFLDFRPPSAGRYEFAPGVEKNDKVLEQRREIAGHFYRLMIEHVRKVLSDIGSVYPDYDPKQGHEVAGFVWFQGCNDFGDAWTYPNPAAPGGFDEYTRLLGCLISDVREEFDAPAMKAVIGVMGINGSLEGERPRQIAPKHIPWLRELRRAMAAPASSREFKGNVAAVHTEEFWEPKLEELQSRWGRIKAKDSELKREQAAKSEGKVNLRRMRLTPANQARLEAFKKTVYTEAEAELMKVGISNAAYHYLGSAKIMARIGKAFAEAMIGMSRSGPAGPFSEAPLGEQSMTAAPAQAESVAFPGEKSLFENRFAMYRDGGNIVVVPERPAPGKPWVWRARFWRHEPQFDVAMLEKGYHVVYCNVGGLLGNPTAVGRWDRYYRFLVEEHGFAAKAVLEGMSRGGMIIYNWAIANPDKVAAIYGDAPVMDLRGWPGFKSGMLRRAYKFKDEEEFGAWKGNPVDNLKPLAEAGVPIIHVVGDKDDCVRVSEHTAVAERRYKEMGGVIEVIHKEDCGHHPHSLKDPTPIVTFVEKHVERKRR